MKRIGVLSDTHGSFPQSIFDFFKDVDEIWHAGDIGSTEVVKQLSEFKPFWAVYGNIDGTALRHMFPEQLVLQCEEVKVLITHIGGYPGKYDPKARAAIGRTKPDLFICGHSHILKVMYDQHYQLLHINPGAAGNSGLHSHQTMVRFTVSGKKIENLEVFDKTRGRTI
jgi:putative phosphoesterase